MPQLPVRLDKDPDIRSPEELVLEMTDLLNEPEFLKDHLVEAYLRDLETVKSNYSSTWALKSKEDIYGWSTAQKAPDQLQLLAAMDRANELVTGYPLRSAQKLAYLCFLRSKPNFGKILQISTGEGKTVIVSLMAVMKALQGHPVDVITSNEVLAE
jgi:replicative superfamily II helicase